MLIRAIGQGGVSTVYAAVDAAHGRKRAIKVVATGSDAGREAMITNRLRHPSVPRVFEYGETPLPDGTVAPYLVLELLRGVPLARRLSRGPLPWREAARIAATTADVPGLPSRLRDLVRACMAKTPNLRPTAKNVALDLWGLLSTPAEAPII